MNLPNMNTNKFEMRTVMIGLNINCNKIFEYDLANDTEVEICEHRDMFGFASAVYQEDKLIVTGGSNRIDTCQKTLNELFHFSIDPQTSQLQVNIK